MKMKRLLSCIMALLLVVSLLPMAALADDNPAETTITTTTENIGTNNGTIEENNHTVENNVAVEIPSEEGNESPPSYQYGTGRIVNNNKVVETNGTQNGGAESGRIQSNNGTVGKEGNNASGNYGTVGINQNGGKVLINQSSGVVDMNQKGGTIETNNGIVGAQSQFGDAEPTSGNYGTVETNNGKVLINQAGGTVETNAASGIVETNKNGGTIDTNYGLVGKQIGNQFVTDGDTGNFGEVTTNYGTITYNKNLVGTNGMICNAEGYICKNDGTVKNNESKVWDNNNKVETNNNNVENNNESGTVVTNNGYVKKNSGEVVTNNGIVDTNKGIVETNNRYIGNNFGTVNTNNIDGTVHNSNTKTLDDVVGTNFGEVNNWYVDGKIYYGLSWGDNVDNLNSIESFVQADTTLNLNDYAAKASRSGYEMTGYTAFARNNGTDEKITSDITNYLMKAPVWLKIMWKQIVTAVEPASNEPEVKTTTIPTSLSAGQVKVGAYVRCGNMTFRIIEVTDNDIRVATVGKLSEKSLA
ncbi:MAG: hypothetical protein MR636_02880, partial [Clostridiales bacterium]|nr:hypothetical protein [Clostridiales bacterium]